MYLLSIGALVYVLKAGVTLSGSTQWIQVGSVTIQPSEFAKLSLIVFLSWILSLKVTNINNIFWLLLTLALTGIPVYLI